MAAAPPAPRHVVLFRPNETQHPVLDRLGLCTYCDMRWPVGGPPPPPPAFCPLWPAPANLPEPRFAVCEETSQNHNDPPLVAGLQRGAFFNRWYTMCWRARCDLQERMKPEAEEMYTLPVIERLRNHTVSRVKNGNAFTGLGPYGPGNPASFIPPTYPQRLMTHLCKVCTEDEQIHYANRISNPAYAAAHPAPVNAFGNIPVVPPGGGPAAPPPFGGFQNSCVCYLNLFQGRNRRGDCATCTRCRFLGTMYLAFVKRDWLQTITRDERGRRVTADHTATPARPSLQTRRNNANKDIPCRCGRDAVAPQRNPRALFCLVCDGVWIDPAQTRPRPPPPPGAPIPQPPQAPWNIAVNWPRPWRQNNVPGHEADEPHVTSRETYNGRNSRRR